MKTSTLFNLIWLCVWAILAIACLTGGIMGNKVHYLFAAICGLFAWMVFTDNGDGESMKAYITRKIKENK